MVRTGHLNGIKYAGTPKNIGAAFALGTGRMHQIISVAELVARGVELRAFEAVAIARALIAAHPVAVEPATAVGPPSLSTVHLAEDGTVSCASCGISPSVSEVAILLSDMLRRSGTKAGGGLRYAIARALLEVDAKPFDSVTDFSRALQRYQQGAHADVICDLWTRASKSRTSKKVRVMRHPDRRRTMASATELRRQLREADRRIYELVAAETRAPMQGPSPPRPFRRWLNWTAAASLALIVITGLVMYRSSPETDGMADSTLGTRISQPPVVENPAAAGTNLDSIPTISVNRSPPREADPDTSRPRAKEIQTGPALLGYRMLLFQPTRPRWSVRSTAIVRCFLRPSRLMERHCSFTRDAQPIRVAR